MAERNWKLNDDLSTYDNILDPVTFDDIILALHCGERVIDKAAVKRVVRDIISDRMQDFNFLLENNMDTIIAEAKKGRE